MLLGDYDYRLKYYNLTKKTLDYQTVLKNENILCNLYKQSIQLGAQIIRIPTDYCTPSWLKKEGMYQKMEQVINVCVSTAKLAMQQQNKDVLIAGTIAPVYNQHQTPKETIQEFVELLVYLTDFNIHTLVFQNFTHWRALKTALETAINISSLPIAPFFPFTTSTCKEEIQDFLNFCYRYHLELVGFEINNSLPDIEEENIGFLLNDPQLIEIKRFPQLLSKKPLMLLGGKKITDKNWEAFARNTNR